MAHLASESAVRSFDSPCPYDYQQVNGRLVQGHAIPMRAYRERWASVVRPDLHQEGSPDVVRRGGGVG